MVYFEHIFILVAAENVALKTRILQWQLSKGFVMSDHFGRWQHGGLEVCH